MLPLLREILPLSTIQAPSDEAADGMAVTAQGRTIAVAAAASELEAQEPE